MTHPVKVISHGNWLELLKAAPGADLDVLTYSFEGELGLIHNFLKRRKGHTRIVAHERFRKEASLLKADNKNATIRLIEGTHAKAVIVKAADWTKAIVGSANFGSTTWKEMLVSVSDPAAVEAIKKTFEECWAKGKNVVDMTEGATPEEVRALGVAMVKSITSSYNARQRAMRNRVNP